MKNLLYLVSSLLFLIGISCENKNTDGNLNTGVELYLVTSYSKIGTTSHINENSVVTQSTPLIRYSDFLSYDSAHFTFELTDSAVRVIKSLKLSVSGLPFAVKADNRLIYTGYFWPTYSSLSCDWIVIDPMMVTIGNKIQVRLGYPGLIQGHKIPDKRNDERIIRTFKLDNKLKS